MERYCNICEKHIQSRGLTAHLIKLHNIKFQNYVKDNPELFPEYYHKCESKDCSNITKPQKKYCSRKCNADSMKTKLGAQSPRFGKTGHKHSEETKTKLKMKRVGRTPNQGNHHTEEQKKKWSEDRSGSGNQMYGKTHKPESIEKIFKHRYKNKLEQLVCDTLDKHNIQYTFQFFIKNHKICKSYDFHIANTDVLIEIDGDYWHGKDSVKNKFKGYLDVQENDKFKDSLAKMSGFRLIRFWESEIKQNPEVIVDKLKMLQL